MRSKDKREAAKRRPVKRIETLSAEKLSVVQGGNYSERGGGFGIFEPYCPCGTPGQALRQQRPPVRLEELAKPPNSPMRDRSGGRKRFFRPAPLTS